MQRNAIIQWSALGAGFLVPSIALAGPRIPQILGLILRILQDSVLVVIGAALLVFLWGIVQFVLRTDDGGKESGRTYMLWGIIALFVMVSVWGLVFMLRTTLGLRGTDNTPAAPRTVVPPPSGSFVQQKPLQAAVGRVMGIVATAIPVLLGLAVLFFVWGVFNFVRAENVDKRAQAYMYIVWGIALLFVLVSVWGLVYAIGQTVGINTGQGTTINVKGGMPLRNLIY